MKSQKILLLTISIFMAFIFMVLPFIACSASTKPPTSPTTASAPAEAKPIVLKMSTFNPLNTADLYISRRMIEEVNKRSNGELTINYVGGPEVIPAYEQMEAARKGIIDISAGPVGNLIALLPEHLVITVSPFTYEEERTKGIQEFWVNLFKERANLHYLGGINKGSLWYFISKKNISNLGDLRGLKSGALTATVEVIKGLQMVPVTIALPDSYSSLAQGVIDTFGITMYWETSTKMWEAAGYLIDQPFFGGSGSWTVVNGDTWNKLPKRFQDLLDQVQKDLEPEVSKYHSTESQKNRLMFLEKAKAINLSASDAKKFDEIIVEAQWSQVKAKTTPEIWAKMRNLYGLPK